MIPFKKLLHLTILAMIVLLSIANVSVYAMNQTTSLVPSGTDDAIKGSLRPLHKGDVNVFTLKEFITQVRSTINFYKHLKIIDSPNNKPFKLCVHYLHKTLYWQGGQGFLLEGTKNYFPILKVANEKGALVIPLKPFIQACDALALFAARYPHHPINKSFEGVLHILETTVHDDDANAAFRFKHMVNLIVGLNESAQRYHTRMITNTGIKGLLTVVIAGAIIAIPTIMLYKYFKNKKAAHA